jgi:DNA-binding NarL/FixJ family response regulator
MLGTPEHVYRALQAGARGYLLKESAGREVMEAVLAVYAGETYLSQPIQNTLISDYLQHKETAEKLDPLGRLSQREREIFTLVIDGLSSVEIGERLSLSPKTVESYRSRMMQKLGVTDLPGLIKFAMRAGLIS